MLPFWEYYFSYKIWKSYHILYDELQIVFTDKLKYKVKTYPYISIYLLKILKTDYSVLPHLLKVEDTIE